ncbi:unnamed protein product, partial [Strongylus vulgaris]
AIQVPVEILPEIIGPAAHVQAGEDKKVIESNIEVPEDYDYAIVIEYHNPDKYQAPIMVEITQQDNDTIHVNGSITVHHCPFATFCREVVTDGGEVATVPLKKGTATVQLHIPKMTQFGLAAVNLVAKNRWTNEYLQQVPVCVRKDGICVPQQHPPAGNSIATEAEVGVNQDNAITGDKLPFPIAHAKEVTVVPLDENQGTLDISGVVPGRGHYMFLVHYFNPDNTPLDIGVLLQNEHYYEGEVDIAQFSKGIANQKGLKLKISKALTFSENEPFLLDFHGLLQNSLPSYLFLFYRY